MMSHFRTASTGTMDSISRSLNRFSFDLSNKISSSEIDKNNAISPLSISATLGLVLLGAREETSTQIKKVLHLLDSETTPKDERRGIEKSCGKKIKRDEVSDVHNQFHELLTQLKSPTSDSVLAIANAAFTQLNFPLLEEYLTSAKELYDAKVETVDFQDDKTRLKINSWVEEKTKGKIKDLFSDSLDKSTSIILVNAVYFKGQWKKKFNVANTTNAPFYIKKDSEISVPMMSQTEKFNFGEIDEIDAQIIELPYATGELSMFIILPNDIAGLQKIDNQITAESLMKWTNSENLTSTKVEIQLPRFKIETSYNLVQYLENMGMIDAFSQQKANLSGISDKGLYVSQMIHKCYIEVNEEGTEAAAATGAVIVPKSLILPKKFIVKHPFLSFIKHITFDTILFHSKVYFP
ncbi:serpin B4-like isoform X2 [Engystomops pustulosus]|uniref:serpin B4-like isoform X2 n=1 Tax=Engystomops pustulosus TaxID=76066 RepID=UPI003AFA9D0D